MLVNFDFSVGYFRVMPQVKKLSSIKFIEVYIYIVMTISWYKSQRVYDNAYKYFTMCYTLFQQIYKIK